MSTTQKTWIGIGGIVVVLLVAFFAVHSHTQKEETANDAALPTASTDTSDAALQKDSAAIDTQLTGLDGDTATVNQGISEAQ